MWSFIREEFTVSQGQITNGMCHDVVEIGGSQCVHVVGVEAVRVELSL